MRAFGSPGATGHFGVCFSPILTQIVVPGSIGNLPVRRIAAEPLRTIRQYLWPIPVAAFLSRFYQKGRQLHARIPQGSRVDSDVEAAPCSLRQGQKLAILDGLRGLMALWVLLGHTCILTVFPIWRLDTPAYAVDGFMILSGFLMTYHYILRSQREPWGAVSTWKAFWTRRFFRVTPLYYLLLIPAYFLMPRYVQWRSEIDEINRVNLRFAGAPTLDWMHLLLHVTYLFGLSSQYCTSLVIPDWSLSLEMQFYLVFPFLMLVAARFGWIGFAALCAGIWEVAHRTGLGHDFSQPSPLFMSILWFAIGMLWASHFFEPRNRKWFALGGCAMSLLSNDRVSVELVCLFAAIIFLDNSVTRPIRQLLSGRVSKFLADASFSVYLVHLFILTPTVYYLAKHTAWPRGVKFAVAASLTALCSYSLAKPFEIIEQFGHKFGKKLATQHLMGRLTVASEPSVIDR